MTKQSERDYYLARIAAERSAAEQAASDRVRSIHLQLAEHYQQIVDGHQPPRSPE